MREKSEDWSAVRSLLNELADTKGSLEPHFGCTNNSDFRENLNLTRRFRAVHT